MALTLCAVSAAADDRTGKTGGVIRAGNEDPVLFVSTPGSAPPSRRAAGAPATVCGLFVYVRLGQIPGQGLTPVANPVAGERYWLLCNLADGGVVFRVITYDPARYVLDPVSLAQYAERSLPLLYPVPSTAPPSEGTQLVGVRTWLWIDPQDFREVSASVSISNLSVTATARPSRVIWDMGDGTEPIDCAGPGTPYDRDKPDAEQHSDCSHVFTTAGSLTAEVYIEWQVTWTASNGASGELGPIRRGVTVPMTVESRQAVITG